ncbi:MAG: aldo/keto reductase [Candidatus Sumerlaeia bacterium]
MEYTRLGRSGLDVSRVTLGTMNFGNVTGEADAFKIMDRALELGITFFDTSNNYGFVPKGLTEQIIGRWLAQGGDRRDSIVLATKFYAGMGNSPTHQKGLTAIKIRRDIEDSLRRLQTDHVDLYQMHHVDRRVGWEELWPALERVVNDGKTIYVGSSNFGGWHIAQAQALARERHFMGLISEQHQYSLVCRLPELEVLPCCKAHGIGVIVYSPLGGGLLSGHALNPSKGTRADSDEARARIEKWRPALEAFGALCKKIGQREADVALAWTRRNDAITSLILGPRNVEQLEQLVAGLSLKLDDETMAELDKIFPGPGGPAPEAYAW